MSLTADSEVAASIAIARAQGNVPLGFATVYQQAGEPLVGVWLTSITEASSAGQTNAVVTSRDDVQTINALMYRRIVVVAGDDDSDLPDPVTLKNLSDSFNRACIDVQERIDRAIDTHAKLTRNRNLTRPAWRPAPSLSPIIGNEIQHKTLAAASYVENLWNWWLDIDVERRKRINFPSISAVGLGDPLPVILPSEFLRGSI